VVTTSIVGSTKTEKRSTAERNRMAL
jgi:hypothetical protein